MSELDEDTIQIENIVRNDLPDIATKAKPSSKKSTTIPRIKAKEKTMAPPKHSDRESSSLSDSNSYSADSETEIQAPKRKRPSDYIAKKDRPENLKSDKKINKLNLDEAIEICKLSAKRAKLDSTSVDSDDAPEKKSFKKFTDDGVCRLHPARFERQPLAPPTKW